MIRPAALVLALAAFAGADSSVVLVDGDEIHGGRVLDGNAKELRISAPGAGLKTIPTSNLVSATERAPAPRSPHPFNLYLRNGDRLHGKVHGDGATLSLDGPGVEGVTVPLSEVKAVLFGRLLASLEIKYSDVFKKELAKGKDVVVVQRETRPFPIYARVLSLGEKGLVVRVGDDKRELPYHRIYGFVRAAENDAGEAKGVRARMMLAGGGRITLPLTSVTTGAVVSGDTRVLRSQIERIEFLGDHIALLSAFDPIGVEEVALFGKAPPWRRDGMVLGGPLRLGGKTYERGIGAQAYSRLEFVLGGRWNHFFARCGIDDAAGSEGDAVFRVHGDGKLLQEVRRRRGEAPAPLRLDVKGVDRLVLEVAPGDSYISDFCDWAEARVFNASPAHD